jgi:hypothetical protein
MLNQKNCYKILTGLTLGIFVLALPAQTYAVNLSTIYAFGKVKSLGELLSYLVDPAFWIAGSMVAFYFFYAALEMIYSHGDKNVIAAARDKMIHAIIGLGLIIGSFVLIKYLPNALGLGPIDIFNF